VAPLQSKFNITKKIILNRTRTIPTAKAPSVSREEIAPSSSRSSLISETNEQLPFKILDKTSKSFRKFNATGPSLLIKFNTPGKEQDPTAYLKEYITALTNYLADNVPGIDLVGLGIHNTENVQGNVFA